MILDWMARGKSSCKFCHLPEWHRSDCVLNLFPPKGTVLLIGRRSGLSWGTAYEVLRRIVKEQRPDA